MWHKIILAQNKIIQFGVKFKYDYARAKYMYQNKTKKKRKILIAIPQNITKKTLSELCGDTQ